MNKFQSLWANWKNDKLLGKVLRNSGYLFSGNLATTIMGFMVAKLLGPEYYGALGVITTYASNVNRFLSFRMNEVILRYAGEHLANGEKDKAAAVIKAAYLTEALTSLVAYLVLLLTAPAASRLLLKDESLAPLIMLYGLMLLANFITESGTAVLQLANAYRIQGILNTLQSFASLLYAVYVYFTGGGLFEVLMAYFIGKLVIGIGTALAALSRTAAVAGARWYAASLRQVDNWKDMAHFIISTNVSSSMNLFFRDSDVLWLGYLGDTTGVGYYKFALAVINVILMPVTTLTTATFPEITRNLTQRLWQPLRRLLNRTSAMAAAWTLACAAGLLVLGRWALGIYSDGAYLPSLPAILILLIGYGTANLFFWNRPLLLSLGLPNFPLKSSAAFGLIKLALMLMMVKPFGYLAQAAITSFYLGGSILVNTIKGVRTLKAAEYESGKVEAV